MHRDLEMHKLKKKKRKNLFTVIVFAKEDDQTLWWWWICQRQSQTIASDPTMNRLFLAKHSTLKVEMATPKTLSTLISNPALLINSPKSQPKQLSSLLSLESDFFSAIEVIHRESRSKFLCVSIIAVRCSREHSINAKPFSAFFSVSATKINIFVSSTIIFNVKFRAHKKKIAIKTVLCEDDGFGEAWRERNLCRISV